MKSKIGFQLLILLVLTLLNACAAPAAMPAIQPVRNGLQLVEFYSPF